VKREVTGEPPTEQQREKAKEIFSEMDEVMIAYMTKMKKEVGLEFFYVTVTLQRTPPWHTGGEFIGFVGSNTTSTESITNILTLGQKMVEGDPQIETEVIHIENKTQN
jgi:hypothetical protein